MSTCKSALMAALAIPLAAVAFAQSARAEDGGHEGWMRSHGDPVAWHKEMCTDRYADRAGHLAKLEAKLDLTDHQRPAFDQWRKAVLDGAAKAREACLAVTPDPKMPPGIVDREAHLESMLSIELQTLQASRPALQALYQALTPEQKAVLDHMGPHGHHGHSGWHHGFG